MNFADLCASRGLSRIAKVALGPMLRCTWLAPGAGNYGSVATRASIRWKMSSGRRRSVELERHPPKRRSKSYQQPVVTTRYPSERTWSVATYLSLSRLDRGPLCITLTEPHSAKPGLFWAALGMVRRNCSALARRRQLGVDTSMGRGCSKVSTLTAHLAGGPGQNALLICTVPR
jgi:hypothetical protein